ncbi:MAG: ABC transporter permease, partial [Clostridia bacterium]|nr:ABC transporter permease [Clostridia bacterium]
ISAEELDMSGFSLGLNPAKLSAAQDSGEEPKARLFADYQDIESSEALASSIKKNNLSAFKTWLDDPKNEIRQHLGENGVVYGYDVSFSVYTKDKDGVIVDTAASLDDLAGDMSADVSIGGSSLIISGMQSGTGAKNLSQLMPGAGGELVSPVVTDSYELLAGTWPAAYDQAVLVLDRNNALSAGTLYQLGLMTAGEYTAAQNAIKAGGEAEKQSWDFAQLLSKSFYLVPACDRYVLQEDGTFAAAGDTAPELEKLLEGALELKISGVIRPKEDAANADLTAPVGYTAALTDYIIARTDGSPVVTAQEKAPETNVLTGLAFAPASDGEKAADAAAFVSGMGMTDKAKLYTVLPYYGVSFAQELPETAPAEGGLDLAAYDPAGGTAAMPMGESAMAAALDRWLEESPEQEILLMLYEQFLGDASYAANMEAFGKVRYDAPSSISIYADTFEDKEVIADAITRYNEGVAEENRITYTDYVALLTGSITSIVDVISYVLIAFVAVSLVVSCIMIGIITHISVLERTREIGILRALGASKRNISQVFNAETVIIGLFSGMLGVAVSALIAVPINVILRVLIHHGQAPKAALPPLSALILVVLSVGITVLGGLIPAKKAARKDPVIALRTE